MNEWRKTDGDEEFVRQLEQQFDAIESDDSSQSDRSSVHPKIQQNRLAIDLLREFQQCPELLKSKKASVLDTQETALEQTHVSTSRETLPPLRSLGRFVIEREIGRGGNGVVVLAKDVDLRRYVAIKIPRLDTALSKENRQRFIREAKAAALLGHPGLVTVHEFGEDQGVYFIVNEYVDGPNLADWLIENSVTPIKAATAIESMADAIQHAHCRGVLHRDLKPSNVMVESKPGGANDERFRITDFGLAVLLSDPSGLTQSGALVGTPAYMSPEQASGKNELICEASDVYGLGVILYQMLTGKPPFEHDDVLEVVSSVRNKDPLAPNRIDNSVPADLNAICLKCLEKQPQQRYDSAIELQKDLQRFLDGEPVLARPVSKATKMIRLTRRYPQTSGLVAAVFLLLLLTATVSSMAAMMLSDSKQEVLKHLEKEIAAKDAATKNEELAIRALYEANLAASRAMATSGVHGQRLKSIEHISSAAAQVDRLKLGNDQKVRLRTSIVDCVQLIDVEVERELQIPGHDRISISHDCNSDLYAFTSANDATVVSVRNLNVPDYKLDLKTPNRFYLRPHMRFSRDSKYLAMQYKIVRGNGSEVELVIWDLETATATTFEPQRTDHYSFDFSSDGSAFAFVDSSGGISWVDLESMKVIAKAELEFTPSVIQFSNQSTSFAFCHSREIKVVEPRIADGVLKMEPTVEFDSPSKLNYLEFDLDDQELGGAGENGRGYIWHANTGKLRLELNRHGGRVHEIHFHPNYDLISTRGYDDVGRLWDSKTGDELLQSSRAQFGQFSSDGKKIEFGNFVMNLCHNDVYSHVKVAKTQRQKTSVDVMSVHPNNRLLSVSWPEWIEFFDLESMKSMGGFSTVPTHYRFSGDGKKLYAGSERGLFEIPIESSLEPQAISIKFGPSKQLDEQRWYGYLSGSTSDSHLFVAVRYPVSMRAARLFDNAKLQSIALDEYPNDARWSDMSGDGKLVAIGTWHGRSIDIIDIKTRKIVQQFPSKSALVRFSPSGKFLGVDHGSRVEIYNTENWEMVLGPIPTQNSAPLPLAFSAAAEIVAISKTKQSVQLVDLKSGNPILDFQVPNNDLVSSIEFTLDGKKLLLGCFSGEVHCWDLSQLQSLLDDSGIGYPLFNLDSDSKRIEFKLDTTQWDFE